jgi:hypothetical protein
VLPVLPNPPNPPNGLALAIVVVLVVAGLEVKPLPNPPKPPVVPLGAMDELTPPKPKPELVVEVVPLPRPKLGAVYVAPPKEKPVLPNPAERKSCILTF